MTDGDAERQLERVDELAARLRTRAGLVFAAVALAAMLLVQVVLSWLPPGWWSVPGSFVPLIAVLALFTGISWLSLRAMRAHRRLGARELIPEIESSTGLRRGELEGARELAAVPRGASASLALRQRARVAGKLTGRTDSDLVPTRLRESRRRLWFSSITSVLAFLCLVATIALRPAESRAAAVALVRPWRLAFPPPPPPMRIERVGGPVLRGDRATVRVYAPERQIVSLHWRVEGEPVRRAGVSVNQSRGTAEGETSAVHVPMAVWAEDLDGRASDTLVVQPVDPLLAAELRVVIVAPAWAGRQSDTLDGPIPSLTVEPGTTLRVSGRTNHPLRAGSLVSTAGNTVVAMNISGDRFSGELRPDEDASWIFDLVPAAVVPGVRPPPPLEVHVVSDRSPVVRVIRPGRDVEVTIEPTLPLVVDASDDVGIHRLELTVWRISAAGLRVDPVQSKLADGSGEPRRIVQAELPLSGFSLAPGDTLFYQVHAQDGNPATSAGASRIWRVVMPSIEELRRSATKQTGELAEEADALADEVRDLGERAREASASMASAGEAGATGFEATEEARAVEQLGREVESHINELEQEIAELKRGLESSPVSEPSLRHRLDELGSLLQELRESGLADRLRALEEALRGLDPSAVRNALDAVSEQAADLERRVDEAADLMERVATEQATRDAALEAAELSERQARAAETFSDSDRWAEDEADLAAEADELAERLQEVKERLEANGADRSADSVGAAESEIREAVEAMREAAGSPQGQQTKDGEQPQPGQQAAQGEQSANGSRAARDAASSMKDAARQMEEAARSLSADWKQEAVEALSGASRQALDLAREQADLAEQMQSGSIGRQMAGRQDAIARGLDQVLAALSDASRKSALVDRRVGPTAAQARDRMRTLVREMSDGLAAPGAASTESRELAEELNELAGRLRASRKAMEGAESGTGMEEALEMLSRLSEAQAGLNRDAGGLMMSSGTGSPIPADMEAIAARQRRIAEQLRELAEESGTEGLPARPEALASEADEIARTLRETGIDRETLERQERLFRRLLDAGRTLERDPDPNRRESRTAAAGESAIPPEPPAGALAGPRYPYPAEAALRSVSPATRRLILDYFDRLNRSGSASP